MTRPLAFLLLIALPVGTAAIAQAPTAAARPNARFQRDPALFKAHQAKAVAALRTQAPAAADEVGQFFATQDVLALVQPTFAKLGLDSEDAIDMTAAYWIVAWEAAQGFAGRETDPKVAAGARAQLAGAMQKGGQIAKMTPAIRQEIADTMLLQALLADMRMQAADKAGAAQKRQMSDAIHREASALLKVDMRQTNLTAAGFTPKAAVPASGPAAALTAPAAGGGKAGPVAGHFFRATYGLGVTIDFEPLALFKNGDYVEMDETPLADLDPAADKAKSPVRWGRWRVEGGTYYLTDNKGRTNDYRLGSGNFFPAFPAEAGPKLTGAYKRTTSGGDYAMGGATSILVQNKLTFAADGSFTGGAEMGAVSPNVSAGSRRSNAGRWTLSGNTMELRYSDGRVERRSFVFGASGTPPRPDADMIFIGGDAYIRD